jgi:hypothetical protein
MLCYLRNIAAILQSQLSLERLFATLNGQPLTAPHNVRGGTPPFF